jgi:hypothetical protein
LIVNVPSNRFLRKGIKEEKVKEVKRRAVVRGLRFRTVDDEPRPRSVIGGDEDDGFPGRPCLAI